MIRHGLREGNGVDRTDLDAGLRSAGAPSFSEIRRICAEIALLRPLNIMVPLDTARNIGAAGETQLAPDAELRVDHPDVSLGGIGFVRPNRPNRADLDAGGILTLAAGGHKYVIRPIGEGVLLDLDARQGVGGLPRVGQGAGHHAGAAALAFLQIDEEKAFGVGYGEHLARQEQVRPDRCSKAKCADAPNKLPP